MSDDNLPRLLDPDGEIVQVVTAAHLLQAAGIVDPRIAELDTLARFMDGAQHLAAVTREAEGMVGAEVIRRMDRKSSWTLRVGGLTLKSSSPSAGTQSYDNERLAAALAGLVECDVIDQDAATAAIEWVEPPAPAAYWKQSAAGIKALLKLGGPVAEAVLSAQVPVEPPKRKAKVARS